MSLVSQSFIEFFVVSNLEVMFTLSVLLLYLQIIKPRHFSPEAFAEKSLITFETLSQYKKRNNAVSSANWPMMNSISRMLIP